MPAAAASQQDPSPPSRWRYWWLAGLAAVYSSLVYANALANPYAYDDMRTVQNNPSIESIYAVKRIVLTGVDAAAGQPDLRPRPGDLAVGAHRTSPHQHPPARPQRAAALPAGVGGDRGHAPQGRVRARRARLTGHRGLRLGGALRPAPDDDGSGRLHQRTLGSPVRHVLPVGPPGRAALDDGPRDRWAVTAVVLWIAALLSKEVAVFWPIVASLYDHYVLASPPDAWRKRFRRLYLPLLLLTATAGAARIGILVLIENPGEAHVMWQYIPVEIVVAVPVLAADGRADGPDDLPRGGGGQDAVRCLVPPGPDVARAVARHRVAGPAHERARIARHVLVRAVAGALGDSRPARSRRADGGASRLHVVGRTFSGDRRGHGMGVGVLRHAQHARAAACCGFCWRPG